MQTKYDYDNIFLGLPAHENHTFIVICRYRTRRKDRFTTDSLEWAKRFTTPKMIINLNIWPKHKKE